MLSRKRCSSYKMRGTNTFDLISLIFVIYTTSPVSLEPIPASGFPSGFFVFLFAFWRLNIVEIRVFSWISSRWLVQYWELKTSCRTVQTYQRLSVCHFQLTCWCISGTLWPNRKRSFQSICLSDVVVKPHDKFVHSREMESSWLAVPWSKGLAQKASIFRT